MAGCAWLVGAMERQAPRVWLDSGVVAVLQKRALGSRDETGALGVQGGEGITGRAGESSAGRLGSGRAWRERTVYVVWSGAV